MFKVLLKLIGVQKLILLVWDIVHDELVKIANKTERTTADDKLIELLDNVVKALAVALGEVNG